jgi:putative PIN family toxin of toxin-antitoxin system
MQPLSEVETQPVLEVVFDCNTFLRATIQNHGPAYGCLSLLDSGCYTLYFCREIADEIHDVLRRPSLRERFPRLTEENVNDLLQKLKRHAVEITNVPETFRYARDPDDEVYVNLALITNAQYLVTYDKDLLDLMSRGDEEARSFRHRFPGLQIVDPQAFLNALFAV